MKLSKWCKINGLSYQTGWNLFRAGKLPGATQLSSGTILVDSSPKHNKPIYNVVYARVSSSEQRKTNLQYQADRVSRFIEAQGKEIHRVVKEVGSGLNDNRKELISILTDEKITDIYVEHQDRLTRFGFNYIKMICDLRNVKIHIINQSESDETDLMKDFVSLVTSFCARLYGLRRSKRNTEKLIKQLQSEE